MLRYTIKRILLMPILLLIVALLIYLLLNLNGADPLQNMLPQEYTQEMYDQLAAKYGRTVAQVCVAWCLQKQIVPLPKSVTPERIKENLDAIGFKLSENDIEMIDRMPNFGWSGQHPDSVDF